MMSDKKIGDELLIQDENKEANVRNSSLPNVSSIIRRSQFRAKVLGWITAVLWGCVAFGVVLYVYAFFVFLYPKIIESWLIMSEASLNSTAIAANEAVAMKDIFTRITPQFIMAGTIVWGGLLGLSAASTILFVTVSRRATVYQFNEAVREISEQLRQFTQQGLVKEGE